MAAFVLVDYCMPLHRLALIGALQQQQKKKACAQW